ncbi:hypothetical protein Hanom_Chr12g01107421 [Helianthus anomalus]
MCCCRYHCDVADQRLAQHIDKGNEDGLLIRSVASCSNLWALIMDSCTERFNITVMATARTRWAIVPLWNFNVYPSEVMHKRWDAGYRITLTASTSNQAAFVLSIREENLQMIHRTHFALLCFLAHMSRLSFMFVLFLSSHVWCLFCSTLLAVCRKNGQRVCF